MNGTDYGRHQIERILFSGLIKMERIIVARLRTGRAKIIHEHLIKKIDPPDVKNLSQLNLVSRYVATLR